MHRAWIAILALPLLAAAPDRDWYRICRSAGLTVYVDLRSIEGTGTRVVADELAVLDTVAGRVKAIRVHLEFDCEAHQLRGLTQTYVESDGDEFGASSADFGLQPAEKDRVAGRMLAFACDPESSDAPLVEDPLHDESADQAPAVS